MIGLVWQGGDVSTVEDVPAASPGPHDVVLDVAWTGLCGTDLHITDGSHPRARPGLVLGHEVVGRLSTPAAGLPAGAPVFVNPLLSDGTCPACRRGLGHVCEALGLIGIDRPGGAAEQVAVPVASLVALPAEVDLRQAALIEPVAVAVRAVRRGGVQLGDRVHVVGAGPIGLLVGRCAQLAGAGLVTVSEPSPDRAARAGELGLQVVSEVAAEAEVVFDCTGHPSVSPGVTRWVRTGGRLVTTGVYPGVVGLDLQDVLFRELTVIGTRVYTPSDVAAAVELVVGGGIDVDPLITRTAALTAGPQVLDALRAGSELKVLLAGPAA